MGESKESNRKPSGYRFASDTLKLTPGYNIISQNCEERKGYTTTL